MNLTIRFLPRNKHEALKALNEAFQNHPYPHPSKFEQASKITDEHLNSLTLAWPDIWEEQVTQLQDLLRKNPFVWSVDTLLITQ